MSWAINLPNMVEGSAKSKLKIHDPGWRVPELILLYCDESLMQQVKIIITIIIKAWLL